MKIRAKFVSNSSSSSFTCDICGYEQSGEDLCLSDAEMHRCLNRHLICNCHLNIESFSKTAEEKRQLIRNTDELDQDELLELEQAEDTVLDDWLSDLIEDLRYNLPANLCPVCTLESPTAEILLKYALYKLQLDKTELLAQLRKDFSSLEELNNHLTTQQK